MVGAIVGGVVALSVVLLVVRLEWRWLRFVSAKGAVRRLRRYPEGSLVLTIPTMGWAWDPTPAAGRSFGLGRVYGPGAASYRLDHDTVHFTMVRRDGSQRHGQGPVPAYLVDGTPAAKRAGRVRWILLLSMAIYPTFGLGGFLVGYFVVTGHGDHARFLHGLTGMFVGFFGVALLLHFGSIVAGSLIAASRRNKTRGR
jgi:hypothetical protein